MKIGRTTTPKTVNSGWGGGCGLSEIVSILLGMYYVIRFLLL